MTLQIALVLAIAIAAMALFITEKVRMDIVAMLVLVSLAVTGLVSAEQALSGFSNQATITVAAMFMLAAGLQNSGSLSGIGRLLEKSKSPTLFLLALFGLLAVIAPFVNNTAIVAVFMPIVIASSLRIGMSPTKALIPLSYVAQMTGVMTLIGTSTNLIVNSVAQDLGYPGFRMFEFLPLGAVCLVAGCLYLLTIGRWLLPDHGEQDMESIHEGGFYVTELRVTEDSALLDTPIEDARLGSDYRVYVLELWRDGRKLWSPRSGVLRAGDVLLARGKWPNLEKLKEDKQLEFNNRRATPLKEGEADDRRVMAEVMISPNSSIQGHTLGALKRYLGTVSILGVQRRGHIVRDHLDKTVLQIGDILLLVVRESLLVDMRKNANLIILSERQAPRVKGWRAPAALAIMAAVVAVSALGWVSIAVAAIAGSMAMVLIRSINLDEIYETIDWRILLLMAGLLPLGAAMSDTGAARFIVDGTLGWVSTLGPHVVLAVLYMMALLLGEMMSNSASAVLLTPIGISTAQLMGTDATPFLIAITFSASTSFLTPVGYQTNTMVYSAGGYRFTDFIKVGLPLNLIFWVIGVILIPVFWPFHPTAS